MYQNTDDSDSVVGHKVNHFPDLILLLKEKVIPMYLVHSNVLCIITLDLGQKAEKQHTMYYYCITIIIQSIMAFFPLGGFPHILDGI